MAEQDIWAQIGTRNANCAAFNSTSEKLANRIRFQRNELFFLKELERGSGRAEDISRIPAVEKELAELLKQAAAVEFPAK